MHTRRSIGRRFNDESGHAIPAAGALIGAVGVVALGIGAANDTSWLTIAGGIVGGGGLFAAALLDHVKVDYGIFDRLESLEGKKK